VIEERVRDLASRASTRGPRQRTSSEDVDVKVRHGLTSMRPVVHYDAEAFFQVFGKGGLASYK